ncbi:MAG: NAD(P)-dependent oxidoreductase [Verrucomicrobia bacterium]|nr:NAD(P)-dependent oxidoreductase [Verrucomicrobiota bacterium]
MAVAGNPKHAWAEVAGKAPPKRGAEERIHDFGEIYDCHSDVDARAQASRCIQCPDPLCRQGCALCNRIPEWLALAAKGEFLEAAAISRSTSNLPEICARVCPQERLCEGACILGAKGDPVAIGAIERFINDYAFAHHGVDVAPAEPNGFRVAVVGSGPGGLSCADELSQGGYDVTVYEAQLIPGGLLVNGIPAFKLDKQIVERRVELLTRRGVKFKLGVEIGKDISLEHLRREHDAVFLSFGAQRPKPLDLPGAGLKGIVPALPFLIQKNVKSPLVDVPPVDVAGKCVAVLGGGDTAMDCLRTAIRSGAREAVCIYRRDLANMPGSRKEYANALEEGARFEFLSNPVEIVPDDAGNVKSVRCVRMELGAPDASGRRSPKPVPGSDFIVAADILLVAYGFDPIPFSSGNDAEPLKTDRWGSIVVDANQMTSLPGVFSGGDAVRGPSLVVHAVRDARKAARGIHCYLQERVKNSLPPA